MTDKEYLGLRRDDTIYALGYGSADGPEIVAYLFESRATGGRIFARKPSALRPAEDAVFRLHVSSTYLTPSEAALAHLAEARRAVPYFEARLAEARVALDAARAWARARGVKIKD
ncbi:MAG TPA: hypothetical protein VN905_06165 [Candidatus Binatia bacterium]|nr:hypothetical protein [Candidatus Binatia bacterium]